MRFDERALRDAFLAGHQLGPVDDPQKHFKLWYDEYSGILEAFYTRRRRGW